MAVGGGGYVVTSLHDGYQIEKFSSNKQAMVKALAYDEELEKLFLYCRPKEYTKGYLDELLKENNFFDNVYNIRMAVVTGRNFKKYWDTIISFPVYRDILAKMSKSAAFGDYLTEYLDKVPSVYKSFDGTKEKLEKFDDLAKIIKMEHISAIDGTIIASMTDKDIISKVNKLTGIKGLVTKENVSELRKVSSVEKVVDLKPLGYSYWITTLIKGTQTKLIFNCLSSRHLRHMEIKPS